MTKQGSWRFNFILIFFFLFGLLLLGRLFYIQVVRGELYKAWAQGQFNIQEEAIPERGEIFFRNGESLAVNMEWPLLYASPREVLEKETTAEKLAPILNLDKNWLLEKLKEDNLYEILKKRLSDEELENIKELKLAGIYLGKEAGRYYPQETMASQTIGFLDVQKQGQYGLEEYYNEILQPGKKEKGSDIVLTLDYSIQFTAEKLLEKAKENLEIESGEIVVINPNSGEILALANFPNFNPNQYSQIADFSIFQNGATQKIFEPGSVFKPLTMAAALEEGKVTPQTIYVDEGSVKIGGYTIFNYDNRIWGEKTMTEVLEKSINTGAVFAEKQLDNHQLFLKYVKKFGIFESTGVDLAETYSENKELKKGYEINFATAAFGQGVEMTPLQLTRAYAAIVNGGKLVKPYLLQEIRTQDTVIENSPKIDEDLIISAKTTSQLIAMLVSVVEKGYAKTAQIPGYYVGGKTGTAQIAWSALGVSKSGYSDKTRQSFMGFAPAFNPQFLVLVKLDNPKTKTAEYSAVPIFHDLAKFIIDYYQIPPDYQEGGER